MILADGLRNRSKRGASSEAEAVCGGLSVEVFFSPPAAAAGTPALKKGVLKSKKEILGAMSGANRTTKEQPRTELCWWALGLLGSRTPKEVQIMEKFVYGRGKEGALVHGANSL